MTIAHLLLCSLLRRPFDSYCCWVMLCGDVKRYLRNGDTFNSQFEKFTVLFQALV